MTNIIILYYHIETVRSSCLMILLICNCYIFLYIDVRYSNNEWLILSEIFHGITCEPVSIHCKFCPVKVFQNLMHRSTVPPPEASRPCWKTKNNTTTIDSMNKKHNVLDMQLQAKGHALQIDLI